MFNDTVVVLNVRIFPTYLSKTWISIFSSFVSFLLLYFFVLIIECYYVRQHIKLKIDGCNYVALEAIFEPKRIAGCAVDCTFTRCTTFYRYKYKYSAFVPQDHASHTSSSSHVIIIIVLLKSTDGYIFSPMPAILAQFSTCPTH